MGDLHKYGTPSLLILTGIYFSPNFSLRGVSRTKFETHVGGLGLKTGGPDAHTQKVAVKSDKGSLKVLLRGLCFLPLEMVGGVLELGEGIMIAEVAEKLYPHLLCRDPATTAFNTSLDWIQE